jgi:hypothetical protein
LFEISKSLRPLFLFRIKSTNLTAV